MPPPRRPKPRRTPFAVRLLLFSAVVALGASALYAGRLIGNIARPAGSFRDFLATIRDPRGRFPGKDRIVILLVGKDYNRNSKGMPITREYSVDPNTGKSSVRNISRADSILLLSLDLASSKVSALSIPRDTRVTAPDGRTGKINATFARGGHRLLRGTLADLTGVAPDYYVAVKPDAVREMVDMLGGVEVETLDRMKYDDSWGNLHIDLSKGVQTINGEQAVGFARFREVNRGAKHSLEEGDSRRMARQQQLIRAMVAEAKHPRNLVKADRLIAATLRQLETDLKPDQIYAIAALFRGLAPESIASGTLMGEGTLRGAYYFLPDPDKTKALVDWLLLGNEAAANLVTKVAVYNGTDVPRAARRISERLRNEAGFDAEARSTRASEPRDGMPATEPRTRILYTKASFHGRAKAIAALLGGGEVVKDTAPDTQGVLVTAKQRPDISVILGNDLVGQETASQSLR